MGHMSPEYIVTEAIPTYIYTNQSQKGDASQPEAMSHTPLTVLISPGWDYVAVYAKQVSDPVLVCCECVVCDLSALNKIKTNGTTETKYN